MSLEHIFRTAQTFDEFLQVTGDHAPLWHAVVRRTTVASEISDQLNAHGGQWHILVLAEDWCGDAVNSLPVIAQLVTSVSNVDLRIVSRDANPDLMDAHLSPTGGRAIPVVLLLDDEFAERGWWGSRPRALQAWIDTDGAALSKQDRYREARRWYVADRGASTAREIAHLITEAAVRAPAARAG